MKCVIKEDGLICRDSKKILFEQRKFYNKLYSHNPEVFFHYKNNNSEKQVKEIDRKKLDAQITLDEFSKALYSLSSNHTPGITGLPPEFYKVFWSRIKYWCFNAFMYAIE